MRIINKQKGDIASEPTYLANIIVAVQRDILYNFFLRISFLSLVTIPSPMYMPFTYVRTLRHIYVYSLLTMNEVK